MSERDTIIGALVMHDSFYMRCNYTEPEEFHIDIPNIIKDVKSASKFFSELSTLISLKRMKAFVMVLMDLTSPSLKSQSEFKERCRDICRQKGIFFYSPSMTLASIFCGLLSTKTLLDDGESVIIINSEFGFFHRNVVKRVDGEYILNESGVVEISSNAKILKERILGNFSTSKVILMSIFPNDIKKKADITHFKAIKDALKGCNFKVMDKCYMENMLNVATAFYQHLTDEKKCEYFVTPCCYEQIGANYNKWIIKADGKTQLPFEETVVIDILGKDNYQNVSLFGNVETRLECMEKIFLTQFKTKKAKVSLKIDINMIIDFKVQEFTDNTSDDSEASTVTKTLEKKLIIKKSVEKAKVIFGINDFSVTFWENGIKKSLKGANGSSKIPIYIAFVEEVPTVGEAAKKLIKTKPAFVVYDFMKISCMENINDKDPKWPFKVSKNKDGDIMLDFETFRGRRKTHPSFLLAILLKHCLKLIMDETDVMLDELEIGFNGLDTQNQLIFNFMEAAKSAKIDLSFV